MRYLAVLVFTSGAVTLGMELSAARLLEPVFGNNQIVWTALIGLILFCLAVGAWWGGRLADRFPRRRELDLVLTLAALGVALAPAASRPVLEMAARGMAEFALGVLVSALIAVFLLFAVPGILLGMTTPWALRLALRQPDHTGRIAGRLTAISTAGSLVGTFLPVLWLVPTFGTRWTFSLLALALLTVISAGTLRTGYRWVAPLAWVAVLSLALWTHANTGPLAGATQAGELIYARESVYNTIHVRQWGSERHLKLNDGIGLHSVYHPDSVLSRGIWDYFLLAPLFTAPLALPGSDDPILLIGLAAGTVSSLYTDLYSSPNGPPPITGVELDPDILAVGTTYFNMARPNLTAVAADGRAWLAAQPRQPTWRIIAVDAYRPPYIPFHLTTVEFFRLAHATLRDDGVLAINIGRTPTDFSLVDALAATVATVFPSVFLVDEPGPPQTLGNTLLIATKQPITLEAGFFANVEQLPDHLAPELRDFARAARTLVRLPAPPPNTPILTDDRAPVERIVHGIILSYLAGR